MLKTVVAGLTALFVTASSLAYAQAPSTAGSKQEEPRLSAADLSALTDARIAIVKAALQLTPEQAKYWPVVEEATDTSGARSGFHERDALSANKAKSPTTDTTSTGVGGSSQRSAIPR